MTGCKDCKKAYIESFSDQDFAKHRIRFFARPEGGIMPVYTPGGKNEHKTFTEKVFLGREEDGSKYGFASAMGNVMILAALSGPAVIPEEPKRNIASRREDEINSKFYDLPTGQIYEQDKVETVKHFFEEYMPGIAGLLEGLSSPSNVTEIPEELKRTAKSPNAKKVHMVDDSIVGHGINYIQLNTEFAPKTVSPEYAQRVLKAVEKGERIPDQQDFDTNQALISIGSSFGANKASAKSEGKEVM